MWIDDCPGEKKSPRNHQERFDNWFSLATILLYILLDKKLCCPGEREIHNMMPFHQARGGQQIGRNNGRKG